MHNPTPGLPEFDYIKPDSLDEASSFLAEHAGEARPFLGGTDTFVRMRDGYWKEKYLVDIKGLPGMREISFNEHNGLVIGAAVNMNSVIADPDINQYYPLLAQAARTVASYQLRSRATIVGNICNASPAGDTIGCCMVLDGALLVYGTGGQRLESLDGFFIGPGKTRLQPGDIVAGIQFPPPHPGQIGRYLKLGRNAQGDLAIVGVTVSGRPDSLKRSGHQFRIVLASVAPIPLVAREAEEILAMNPISDEVIASAAAAAQNAATPISDPRASARYRSLMVRNLTQKGIMEVWEQLRE